MGRTSTPFPAAAVAAGLARPSPCPRLHTALQRVAASTPLPSRLLDLQSRGRRGVGVGIDACAERGREGHGTSRCAHLRSRSAAGSWCTEPQRSTPLKLAAEIRL